MKEGSRLASGRDAENRDKKKNMHARAYRAKLHGQVREVQGESGGQEVGGDQVFGEKSRGTLFKEGGSGGRGSTVRFRITEEGRNEEQTTEGAQGSSLIKLWKTTRGMSAGTTIRGLY